jgi:ElaB/YqjD/DUF883 family membrane-anchored ribosome-binding protein
MDFYLPQYKIHVGKDKLGRLKIYPKEGNLIWSKSKDQWIDRKTSEGKELLNEIRDLLKGSSSNSTSSVSSAVKEIKKTLEKLDCSICLEKISDSIVITKCEHVFHEKCLTTWLDKYLTCPLCRTVCRDKKDEKKDEKISLDEIIAILNSITSDSLNNDLQLPQGV